MEPGIYGVNSFATHTPGHTARLARLAEELGYRKNSWSQTVALMTDPSGQEGAFPDGLLLDHRPVPAVGKPVSSTPELRVLSPPAEWCRGT